MWHLPESLSYVSSIIRRYQNVNNNFTTWQTREENDVLTAIKNYLNRLFITGLSGMALGLFATLIIGTIAQQIGKLVGGEVGTYMYLIGKLATIMTGAGIGIGVACKYGESPLVTVSAAVAGMVGAYATVIIKGSILVTGTLKASGAAKELTEAVILQGPGEPLGAFLAAYIAIEVGHLIAGKTQVDIVLTPLVSIAAGSICGILIGPPISKAMKYLGELVNVNVDKSPILGGMIVAVLMGMILTLPISSAAIGVSMGLSGLAAGAATVGCCCQMVGFAVASFRENQVGGLISQGLGTSMLQVPNILRRPLIWIPPILSSAILAPISSAVLKMTSNPVGSGMGSAGLVGQIMTYQTMLAAGKDAKVVLVEIILMHFVLPGVVTLLIAEGMRRINLIKDGDMMLDME